MGLKQDINVKIGSSEFNIIPGPNSTMAVKYNPMKPAMIKNDAVNIPKTEIIDVQKEPPKMKDVINSPPKVPTPKVLSQPNKTKVAYKSVNSFDEMPLPALKKDVLILKEIENDPVDTHKPALLDDALRIEFSDSIAIFSEEIVALSIGKNFSGLQAALQTIKFRLEEILAAKSSEFDVDAICMIIFFNLAVATLQVVSRYVDDNRDTIMRLIIPCFEATLGLFMLISKTFTKNSKILVGEYISIVLSISYVQFL